MRPNSPVRGQFRTGVHTALAHDSAKKHVSGSAIYVDDMPEPAGMLHAAVVLSPTAHGVLRGIDSRKINDRADVVAILTADDIPGANDVAPIIPGEPLLAHDVVEYAGQLVAIVAATTEDAAWAAAKSVVVEADVRTPVLSVREALEKSSFLIPPMTLASGDAERAIASSPHQIKGSFNIGGQEHFYLECQVTLAVPGEDRSLTIYCSSQNPTEVQQVCARLLGVEYNKITVIVRRMGGGFGGKESNATCVAGAAALLAWKCQKPVKLRLPRETDMVMTGKRHGFAVDYHVGFDEQGRINGVDVVMAANGGHVTDCTPGVLSKALTHIDNVYSLPNFRAIGYACKTNTVSNTAFRGYGSPQAVLVMEEIVDRISRFLGKTLGEIRSINYYGGQNKQQTPYGQEFRQNLISRCVEQVLLDSDWNRRREKIDEHNRSSPVIRRGLGMFPVKYGISFPPTFMNQAGALVNVYTDGSIRLGHGGTEMGQGLFIKVAQVVAEVFQVDIDRIELTATSTGEVPNTSPTAASTGSDLNGWAAYQAAQTIKQRMTQFAAEKFGVTESEIEFSDNHVRIGVSTSNRVLEFSELAHLCWLDRVSLSATGFYKTPDVTWNAAEMKGSPFFYFVFGAAVAEVAVDTLTGENRVLRVDIVQDCGSSLNPNVDLGQIEGAFIQGMGWLTSEELCWNDAGILKTRGPSTYKIPGSRDTPPVFNTRILDDAPAEANTIFRSKGIGEPPILLATAVRIAIQDAIGRIGDYKVPFDLDSPATPERVLMAIEQIKRASEPRGTTVTA
jgi:xanthine dehydrogenase large subunit